MSRGWFAAAVLLVPGALAAAPNPWAQPGPAAPQGAPGPTPEISGNPAPVALPAVPSFAVPAPTGEVHTPFELLAAGERLRGTRVKVGGYVTWIYDCAAVLAAPGKTAAQIQQPIDRDPPRCERPKLTIGDTPSTPPDRSLWVVDVPRALNQLEWHLPTGELVQVGGIAVGDHVEVTGTLAIRSPHREVNSAGLIVYEAIVTAPPAPAATRVAPPAAALPPLPVRARPVRSAIPASAGDSLRHTRAGDRAYASRQYDTASAEYEAAIRAWSGNAAAWYGLAGARSWRGDLRAAAGAAERCTALVPDQAMYWLLLGRLRYEAAIAEAKHREARAQDRRADQVIVDRSQLDLTTALEALRIAASLQNQLWRAHYDIGRILRDRGDAKAAAEQLTEAIAQHAWEAGPYIALGEIYRRWQYRDEALAIAELGSTVVPGSAEIWFALGLARDDRGDRNEAIAAYSRALDLQPDLRQVRFQRGRAYAYLGDAARARRDLQAVVTAGGTAFEIEQARHLLANLTR
jgi:tetratricopeptide (TPR) repeat protein